MAEQGSGADVGAGPDRQHYGIDLPAEFGDSGAAATPCTSFAALGAMSRFFARFPRRGETAADSGSRACRNDAVRRVLVTEAGLSSDPVVG